MAPLDQDIPAGINAISDPSVFASSEPPRPRKKPRELREPGTLTITSLMDVMTIILVFLIKSFSTNPVQLKQAKDLKMPFSSAVEEPPNATAIVVTLRSIIVEDDVCLKFEAGKPPEASMSQAGMLIDPCFSSMQDAVEHQKKVAVLQRKEAGFDGTVVIMVDRNVPYDLVTKVMYTAGAAEFSKFKFAVVKSGKSAG